MRLGLFALLLFLGFGNLNVIGQSVNTIKIGNQIWMAENLNIHFESSICYNLNDEFCKKYGKLYTWEDAKNACRNGWRLPTEKDWDILIQTLGGEEIAGNKLKWTGDSGFNARLGGMSNNRGFSLVDYCGAYWTADSFDSIRAWYILFNNKDGLVTKTYFNKGYGFSVRCIKN